MQLRMAVLRLIIKRPANKCHMPGNGQAPLYSPDRDCPALHGSSLGGVARTSLVGLHKDGLRVHAGHRQGWRH